MNRARETDHESLAPFSNTGVPPLAENAMFRQFAEGAPVLMRRSDGDGRSEWLNRAWLDYTGRDLDREQGFGWLDNVHPEDLERCREAWREAFRAGEPFETDLRLRRHDGSYRWFRDTGRPYPDEGGEPIAYLCYGVDVTDRVERENAERRQQSLVDYLNHRMKNTMAMVHSIALQTFRRVPGVDPTLRLFDGRLTAVAASQELLARRDWRGATIRETAETALRPFGALDGSLVELGGPEVMLTPRQTMALAFALHELGANATRFGALSDSGRVSVRWETADDGTGFVLTWRELDGPPVVPPERKGFGARMIERGLTQEFGGSAEIDFAPDGVVCTVQGRLGEDQGAARPPAPPHRGAAASSQKG